MKPPYKIVDCSMNYLAGIKVFSFIKHRTHMFCDNILPLSAKFFAGFIEAVINTAVIRNFRRESYYCEALRLIKRNFLAFRNHKPRINTKLHEKEMKF